jgi:hypothetical protein
MAGRRIILAVDHTPGDDHLPNPNLRGMEGGALLNYLQENEENQHHQHN